MPRPVSLSLDLLRTFVLLAENNGDAAVTTAQLQINQPSMSKRLKYFQHSGRVLSEPWIYLDGKTWRLTKSGEKVLPAVKRIIHTYEQVVEFGEAPKPSLVFASGKQATALFGHEALRAFQKEHRAQALRELRKQHPKEPTAQLLRDYRPPRMQILTDPRGEERIEGVANGWIDLAIVTQDEETIRAIARRPLHVEELRHDLFALACARDYEDVEVLQRFKGLTDGGVEAKDLIGLPLILPEPDSGIRKTITKVFGKKNVLDKLTIVLEIGGWSEILACVEAELGVGLLTDAVLRKPHKLEVRFLQRNLLKENNPKLICRLVQGTEKERTEEEDDAHLDLSDEGKLFRKKLLEAAAPERMRSES